MTASDVYLFAGWTFLDMGDVEKGVEIAQRSVDTTVTHKTLDMYRMSDIIDKILMGMFVRH